MFKIPEYIKDLKPYDPGKPIEELARELGLKKIIKLASNENPLGPSPKAVKAILDDIYNIHRYPDGKCYYLRKKLSQIFKVSENEIIFGLGSNEILDLVARAYLRPPYNAVFSKLSFAIYPIVTKLAGAQAKIVPIKKDFSIDLEGHLKAIDENTKVVFLANPNNPTGTAFSKSEFEDFLKEFPEDVLLVLDEAYYEYAKGANFDIEDGVKYIHTKNILVTRTFSKIYGLAGLRIGYGFAKEEIIKDLDRIRQPFNVPRSAQVAALAAIEDIEHLNLSIAVNEMGKKYLYKEFDKLNLEYVPTYTNFILFKVPIKAKVAFQKLLKKGVIVRDMTGYGLENYLRVTIGTQEENEIFIKALKEVLNEV